MATLSKARAIVTDNPALAGVAVIGFAVSFQTIAHLATVLGLPGWAWLYPAGIDVGIAAMIIESRKAIDDGRSDLVPRVLAWVLAAFTIYVNAHGSPAGDWTGRALHVVMPSLWVAGLELTRWRKLARKRAEGNHDRIPLARWLAAPLRTPGMARRMILHNVSSYPVMVAREEARLLAIDLAASVYGRRWRQKAPALLRHHLRTGTLPDAVASACEYAMPGRAPAVAGPVEDWVTAAPAAGAKAAARVTAERLAIERQADAAEPRQAAPRPKRRKRATPAVAWRDKAVVAVAANPRISAADLALQCGVHKRSAERYLAEATRVPAPVTEIGARR